MTSSTRTEKLYLADPYVAAFEATVVACGNAPDGRVFAVLDKTCFYPESGGQPSDRGVIGGVAVVDVQEDEAGMVRHYLSAPVGTGRVECRVDWTRRFDHMQQHTGQHILSRAFIEAGRLETVSFHLGEEICTIDVAGPEPGDDVVEKAERLANAVVWENRPVAVRNVSHAATDEKSLRKPLPEGVSEVRLVEVEGFDTIGCCGTHVRGAGEIGVIKVLKHEKTKGVHRVYFVAGRRAYEDFARKHEIVKRLANRFTTSVDALEEKVEKLQSEGHRLRKESQRLSKKLVAFEAEGYREKGVREGGRLYVVEVLAEADEPYLRALGSQLTSDKGTVSLLGTTDGLIICSASSDVDVDFSAAVVERAKSRGGTGGGKGRFAMVRLPAGAPAGEFLDGVFNDIKGA
jgi:alanyl-tRNA synthetase